MMQKLLFLATIALLQNLVLISAKPTRADTGKLSQPRLVSLGTVEGKTYFYDDSQRTWEDAKTYCTELGMRLATIKTTNQAAFLKTKYTPGGFDSRYWIGGRDAQTLNQFVWDEDDTPLTAVGQPSLGYAPQYTCMTYLASPSQSDNGGWHSVACPTTYRVMCETF